MKKLSGKMIALIVVLAVVLIAVIGTISSYNGLVGGREGVENKLSDIDTQLQRRSDLVPNLVNTVKGYATHESQVFKDVSDARARLAGAGSVAEKAQADQQMTGAISRLLMVAESYPDLKASAQFTQLADELAGTENRINIARQDFNAAAKKYNQKIKSFPGVIFANIFRFESYDYFKAAEGSEKVPGVDFTK
ncbi:MAG: LemA family protein [Clostridia bacterium]